MAVLSKGGFSNQLLDIFPAFSDPESSVCWPSPPDADAAFVNSCTGPTLTAEGFLIYTVHSTVKYPSVSTVP